MTTYYEAPVSMRRLATFNHSEWDLYVSVEREARGSKYRVVLVLGSGGSILKMGLSLVAATAFAATVTMTPEA